MIELPLPRTTGALLISALLAGGLIAAAPPAVPSAGAAAAGVPETFLVSRTQSATSDEPFLSADGQHVVFTSTAGDLADGDDNGVADVFLATAVSDKADPFDTPAMLVSRPDPSMPQVPADGPSSHPVMSADGRYFAYLSAATNLVPGDHAAQHWVNVYVHDRSLGTTIRIEAPDGEPRGDSRSVDISDDGRYVVFVSDAANLTPGDGNETWDGFIADLDADGNGSRGDVSVTRVLPDQSVVYGVREAVISGNGEWIAFTTEININTSDPAAQFGYVYRGSRASAGVAEELVAVDATEVSIDATGEAIAYISETACSDGHPTIVASNVEENGTYSVAVGKFNIDRRVGWIAEPEITADGGAVAWVTTQPEFQFQVVPPLPDAVVRVEPIAWRDANVGVQCDGVFGGGAVDLGVGDSPSPSASGRTVAFAAPLPADPAVTSVVAVDTHSHDGLSVTTSQGALLTPGFMTVVDIANIPISTLRNYAAALADAPIHQLPIHQLPIHQLPIHQLPIHQLPIHQLAIPGGWTELLADTPFAGQLEQSVLLSDVLDWAESMAPAGSAATPAERAAAERILQLTIDDVDLTGSGIDSLALASLVLGGAPLSEILIPGDGSATDRWKAVVAAQAIDAGVGPATLLADLDAVGLDVGRSGVEQAILRDLPIASTMFDAIAVSSLILPGTPLGAVDASTLDLATQVAVYGGAVQGPLSAQTPLPGATTADLAAGMPAAVTFGDLLFSLLDSRSYPWEQIAPASIDPGAALRTSPGRGCDGHIRCEYVAQYRFSFDPGPGETTEFAAPTIAVTLPTGTVRGRDLYAMGSGPRDTWRDEQYSGPTQGDGNLVRLPLPDMPGGTVLALEFWHTASTRPGPTTSTATLTSGELTASYLMRGDAAPDTFDDPVNNWIDGNWEDVHRLHEPLKEGRLYYEWISPSYRALTDDGTEILGPPVDEDYFLVDPPKPGQRLIISTNAADGQIALALFRRSDLAPPVSDAPASPMPGTAVTEQSGAAGQPAESGGDAAAPFEDHTLVDQAVVRGSGSAEVEAASTDAAAGEQMMLRVTSGNGQSSASLYSLRARYIEEPAEQRCSPAAPVYPGAEVAAVSDPVTATTNTLYLFDSRRMAETYGVAEADRVRAALDTLDGTGHVGTGVVDGAVISIDADGEVVSARAALDLNPCSMSARRTLTTAINSAVAGAIRDSGAVIASVVLVGGDDIIPLAPVAQHTAQFNEESHAASLRLRTLADGSACPPLSSVTDIDLCATPLSAAAATNYILTDDPYGLADAYESLGGILYVPTVGLGRLIETPDQIIATIDRFTAAEGVLEADTTLTGGYGAWSELPDLVTSKLAWRSAPDTELVAPWGKDALGSALFPVVDDANGVEIPERAGSARVVSVNTHADETRMLPGILGAEKGQFRTEDLFTAAGRTDAVQLDGALVFMIGCHAGGNLPSAYYGDVEDWPDVFSAAGGFVGNTGYGLANNVTTALGERLLGLYAEWIGRESGGSPISASGALTYAKQAYLGGLGLYSGYDEKVLMEAVYYGLPMYTFGGELRETPLPEVPDDLAKQLDENGELTAASLSLEPGFATATMTDDRDRQVSYLIADGQDPLVIPGQPILPRVVSQLGAPPEGRAARGALITSLSSRQSGVLVPAIAEPSVGVPDTGIDRSDVAFPSTFATVTSQLTPTGPVDMLVVTPGRVVSDAGSGRLEQFTQMGLEVRYGSTTSTTGSDGAVLPPDTTAPVFRAVDVPTQGDNRFRTIVDPTGDDTSTGDTIVRVLLLTEGAADANGVRHWSPTDLNPGLQDFDGDGVREVVWGGQAPIDGQARWILQAVDAAGNVAIETARGHLDVAGATSPQLGDPGPAATVEAAGRLTRTVTVDDAVAGEKLTGTVTLFGPPLPNGARGAAYSAGPVPIETGSDGVTRAIIDRIVETPGELTATLRVCRGRACSEVSFPVTVPVGNTAPTATVVIEADGEAIWPTSVLTAVSTASDPDGDATTRKYAWHRNGGVDVLGTASTLDLTGKAAPGDVISVVVTPNDGIDDGHQARAEVTVSAEPAPATITLKARAAGATTDYVEGEWSTSDVTVSFRCSSGVAVEECPSDVIVDGTSAEGRLVRGTVTDALGRQESVQILVRVDKDPPVLAPTISPALILVGTAAVASPNATDAASGVKSQSCDVPVTSVAGPATVECRATDNAGREASVLVPYTVELPKCGGVVDRAALPPLNADGSSVFLRTSGVPVVFTACDAQGNPIGAKKFVKGVTLLSATNLTARTVNELWYPPVQAFSYVKASGVWTGNIPTAKLASGKKYTYRVDLADGTSFTVTFGVR